MLTIYLVLSERKVHTLKSVSYMCTYMNFSCSSLNLQCVSSFFNLVRIASCARMHARSLSLSHTHTHTHTRAHTPLRYGCDMPSVPQHYLFEWIIRSV
jgi:hypothetical protein